MRQARPIRCRSSAIRRPIHPVTVRASTCLGRCWSRRIRAARRTLQVGLSSVPAGVQSVSATATDPNGNTSEFSADVPVVATTSADRSG